MLSEVFWVVFVTTIRGMLIKYKQQSFELFTKNGYERLIDNVILNPQGAVEDWYIYPELITGKKIFLKDIEHSKICPLYGFN